MPPQNVPHDAKPLSAVIAGAKARSCPCLDDDANAAFLPCGRHRFSRRAASACLRLSSPLVGLHNGHKRHADSDHRDRDRCGEHVCKHQRCASQQKHNGSRQHNEIHKRCKTRATSRNELHGHHPLSATKHLGSAPHRHPNCRGTLLPETTNPPGSHYPGVSAERQAHRLPGIAPVPRHQGWQKRTRIVRRAG